MRVSAALVMSLSLILCSACWAGSQAGEIVKSPAGDLKADLVGHGSVMFEYGGKVIHVDPFGKMADYSKLPKADLILITHEHPDHLDADAVSKIRTDKTVVVGPETIGEKVKGFTPIKNGDVKTEAGFKIEAVPAYNIVHKRENGQPFHPKGRGNGYVVTFGDIRVYIAGDTENIPEMKDLKDISLAFLPVNLPYTMTGQMAVDAVKMVKPKYVFPYHYDMAQSQLPDFMKLMKDVQGVQVLGNKP
ncbi:MAG: MBL fold metallo-hydrolase [Pseudomonadota bacterium]